MHIDFNMETVSLMRSEGELVRSSNEELKAVSNEIKELIKASRCLETYDDYYKEALINFEEKASRVYQSANDILEVYFDYLEALEEICGNNDFWRKKDGCE